MTTTFKFILFPVGGVLGGILALALKQGQILSESFDGRWIAVTFALGGVLVGHYIDNNRECAQIARELKEEGIEVANAETDTLGRLLIYQSGATCFGSVYYAICTLESRYSSLVPDPCP